MQKQSMWASAALGALWLAIAGSPAAAQEGRPAGTDQGRGQAAPAAQPERGGVRPAEEKPKEGDHPQPAERTPTDRAPQGQATRGAQTDRPAAGQGPKTDAAHGAGPADHLAQIEMKHASQSARIERLMEVYRTKGDQAKVLELEQMRDRELNKYQKNLAGLERELGPERYRAARAAFNEKHGQPVPSERGKEIRTERAAAEEKAKGETDAAHRGEQARGEQARKDQARKQQGEKGPNDHAKGKPAHPPAGGKPADKPADKPASKPERDGGAS